MTIPRLRLALAAGLGALAAAAPAAAAEPVEGPSLAAAGEVPVEAAPPASSERCAGPVCLGAPADVVEDGCLRRGAFVHSFPVRLRDPDARRLRIQTARFWLDWKPDGIARRAPWRARVDGSQLEPGAHLLLADVRLRVLGTRRTLVCRLSYRFEACV